MHFLAPEHYQPHCQQLYDYYAEKVQQLLPHAHIEHIGASAIPGLISKGDLDIYVALDESDINQAIELLKTLNFRVKSNTLRTSQLCMLESTNGDDTAIQLVANGSEFTNFLHFKYALLTHEHLRCQYNTLKSKCEQLSAEHYRQIKSAFIQYLLMQYP